VVYIQDERDFAEYSLMPSNLLWGDIGLRIAGEELFI
jgi:hypothetical protein